MNLHYLILFLIYCFGFFFMRKSSLNFYAQVPNSIRKTLFIYFISLGSWLTVVFIFIYVLITHGNGNKR
jgi:hypothetical protein